jgi:hypothetical protein
MNLMTEICSSLRRLTRLSVIVPLAAIVLNASAASAQPALGKAEGFAVLAGTAVTCKDSFVTGDVGVWPGTAVTLGPNCPVTGAVHAGDGVAKQAYLDFISAYNNIGDNLPTCDAAHTLIGTLAFEPALTPGVYCVDAVAKTGTLTLDGDANDVWVFLVSDGAGTGYLEGNSFNVVMLNGGEPSCNVFWWVETYATLTDSNFLGTILAGAAITVTGGTFHGDALATTAVTLTGVTVTACEATGHGRGSKCNQGVGNGPEGCDPGNSNNHNPSNDERGGTLGNPGRKGGSGT